MASLTAEHVSRLHRVRTTFGRAAAHEKKAILDECATLELRNPRVLRRYHEALLFVAAHPDSRLVASIADSELRRVDDAAPPLFQSKAGANALKGSALAGERVEADFSITLMEWLMDRVPDDIEIAWDKGSAGLEVDDLLYQTVLPVEQPGRLNDRFDMRRWVRFVTGPRSSLTASRA